MTGSFSFNVGNMGFIFCLAHYCDTHGPQSLLCTQPLPEPCPTCQTRLRSPDQSPERSKSLEVSSSLPAFAVTHQHESIPAGSSIIQALQSSTVTPPPTPVLSPSGQSASQASPTGQGYDPGKPTWSSSVDADTSSCASCAFVVPNGLRGKLPATPRDKPSTGQKRGRDEGPPDPILRTTSVTRVPCSTALQTADFDGTDVLDTLNETRQSSAADLAFSPEHLASSLIYASNSSLPRSQPRSTPTSSAISRARLAPHTRPLTYITTPQPTQPDRFTLLRHAVIRALSFETLPPGSSSGPTYFSFSSFISPRSSEDTSALGITLPEQPEQRMTTYTIAHLFRVRDSSARGGRRSFALIALRTPPFGVTGAVSGETDDDEVTAGAAWSLITPTFARVANWLGRLAEDKHERETVARIEREERELREARRQMEGRTDSGSGGAPAQTASLTATSSFLSEEGVDPDGVPRVRRAEGEGGVGGHSVVGLMTGRGSQGRRRFGKEGLADLTGRDTIFMELHVRFVELGIGVVDAGL